MRKGEQIDELLTVAAREGMQIAISRHGKGLNPAEVSALLSLSTVEVRQLGTLRNKLSPLKGVASDNNGGVF